MTQTKLPNTEELPKATASVPETGKVIGYSKNAVYGLIKDKRLRVVKVGRKMRVPLTEIDAFLQREMQPEEEGQ